MLKYRLLDPLQVPWEQLDTFSDRVVFQTRAWLDFVAEAKRAKPVIAELREGSDVAGYFTGLTFWRFGVKILGSSFPGWTTPYMGFNLHPGVERWRALEAVERLAFGDLHCWHMEISDQCFSRDDGLRLEFEATAYDSYETDLRQSEEEIFAKMSSACRRCIRKAENGGVQIKEAQDIEFAEEYYRQLEDVFAKQGLVPTYDVNRVRLLIKHVLPTGNVLLLRACLPDGTSIGTGIFPGLNRTAHFWGNASLRQYQIHRPNELIQWYAMRYWKRRGMLTYDWGGRGTYKEKYGVQPISVPWFYKSRFRILSTLRHQARKLFSVRQRFWGRIRGGRKPSTIEPSAFGGFRADTSPR
jgi:hypothetical protein